MNSCLGLLLATAGRSEILVHVPIRKAKVRLLMLPLLGAFSTQFTAFLSPRGVPWAVRRFSCAVTLGLLCAPGRCDVPLRWST